MKDPNWIKHKNSSVFSAELKILLIVFGASEICEKYVTNVGQFKNVILYQE
jgi:hypothetical protein